MKLFLSGSPYKQTASVLGLMLVTLLLSSCGKEVSPPEPGLNQKLGFNNSEYLDNLNQVVNNADTAILTYADTLKLIYSSRQYQPLFIKSFEDKDVIESLLVLIEKADQHGLNPETYHLTRIKDEYQKAVLDSAASNRHLHLANTEILVSDAVINYSNHLRFGVVNPKEIFPDSYYLPVPDSASRNILEPLFQENILTYLNSIQRQDKKYTSLQEALKYYRQFENSEWADISITKKKIEPGSSDSSLIPIAERLITLGYLDTSKNRSADYAQYDSVFTNAVKDFQRLHGLNPDGVIGASTIQKLNIKPEEYIGKIILSLERFRWIDYSDSPEYILVNVPDFNLYVMQEGEIVLKSKVCTGLKRSSYYEKQNEIYKKNKNWRSRPDDWETPVMYGEISYMVLNPTWTVPQNIMREEIARELKNDPEYLDKKNFKVFKGGQEIAAAQISPTEFSSANIPYTLVQGPGYLNALGTIKFMFTNPFGIYLHDTPSRAPFNNSNRAVSHGCVRVEKPLALSEFLLAHQSKWNIDFLKAEVGAKVDNPESIAEFRKVRSDLRRNSANGKSTHVNLDKKVPLYVDYYTAWVDEDGRVNFRDDVYGKDKKLEEAVGSTKYGVRSTE